MMIAILCPLKSEWNIARNIIKNDGVIIEVGGQGKVNFAIKATELLLNNPTVKTLICLGAGGSLSPEVSPFDVVVADKTVEHDYHEKFQASPSKPQVKGSKKILDSIRAYNNKDFAIHIGSVASGDEDIVTPERAMKIADETQSIAVAWEGIGGAKACRTYGRSFIEVRGITDVCSVSTAQDFSKNLKVSIANASMVVNEMIKQMS